MAMVLILRLAEFGLIFQESIQRRIFRSWMKMIFSQKSEKVVDGRDPVKRDVLAVFLCNAEGRYRLIKQRENLRVGLQINFPPDALKVVKIHSVPKKKNVVRF